MAGGISDRIDHVFRVRILRRGRVDRSDIRVRDNSAACDMPASNSRAVRGRLAVSYGRAAPATRARFQATCGRARRRWKREKDSATFPSRAMSTSSSR